jgi:hypothetical protein
MNNRDNIPAKYVAGNSNQFIKSFPDKVTSGSNLKIYQDTQGMVC